MNIADIEKVANRKRINAEADKLREKVTRETTNIIKLKVAQDTAYWDIKEKLHQLESNHERLQQNMVEVQMQHEALSGQYQDELRLRPETLNKLSSTREICDVLEEYSSRLKATVSRCQADQATLAEAYNKSGQVVRDIKDHQLQAQEKSMQTIANLQEKVKLVTDHKEQIAQMFSSSKLHLETELNDVRTKLTTTLGQKDELFVALNDFSRKLDQGKRELERKDENIDNLQMDIKKLIHELNNQGTQMANLVAKHEKDLKEYFESNETLKKALTNQEQFTTSICDQNNQLQEKISTLEEEQILITDKVKVLENKIQEANSQCDHLSNERTTLNEKKEELEKLINEKLKLLSEFEIKNQDLRAQTTTIEAKYSEKVHELEETIKQCSLKSDKIEELHLINQGLDKNIAEMQISLDNLKLETTEKINDLNTTLNSKDKELDCKVSTINRLMSDLKNVADAKAKLENNMDKLKKYFEGERNNAKEKEKTLQKKIEQMEIADRDKENELSKQMTIILDMRNEKDRLQERLKGMQSTISNIEKEVNGRLTHTLPARQAAELDDNAVMLTPAPMKTVPNLRKVDIHASKLPKPPAMAPSKKNTAKQDDMLYNFFSDSSVDNELTIDANDPVKNKRIFFKSKVAANKAKKFKPDDA